MKKIFPIPRGTSDILPENVERWYQLERQARKLLRIYGCQEIRTPIFEETELFARSVGQTSDIVQKQMLNLAAQGADDARDITAGSLSLRPEGTAAVVRSYIQNNFERKERLSKFFYIGPMFRGERPQKGRLRQFHQIGLEAIGPDSASPYLDAEVISLSVELLKQCGIEDFTLKLNTLGTPEDKERFSQYLKEVIAGHLKDFCENCQARYDRNVFRILDCKNRDCRKAVQTLKLDYSYLSQESRIYYDAVKSALEDIGIEFKEDPCLVRGLDYYTHVVFELSCARLGSQDALGAGGRYNALVQQLGGPKVDAIGFALGIERMLLAAGDKNDVMHGRLDAFIVALGSCAVARAFALLRDLRCAEVSTDMRFSDASLKSQMRQANKLNARHVLILGEEEMQKDLIVVKDMDEGTQQEVALRDMDRLVKILKSE